MVSRHTSPANFRTGKERGDEPARCFVITISPANRGEDHGQACRPGCKPRFNATTQSTITAAVGHRPPSSGSNFSNHGPRFSSNPNLRSVFEARCGRRTTAAQPTYLRSILTAAQQPFPLRGLFLVLVVRAQQPGHFRGRNLAFQVLVKCHLIQQNQMVSVLIVTTQFRRRNGKWRPR